MLWHRGGIAVPAIIPAMFDHPLIDEADQLERPSQTARESGFRMPAEWEPIEQVWLTRPKNEGSWPNCVEKAQQQWDYLVEQIGQCNAGVAVTGELGIPTDDSWIRDYGPTFVVNDKGQLACHDFYFNCWGEVFGPWDLDNLVPQHVARQLGVPVWVHNRVLEGGAIEVNGSGSLLTTEACLLNRPPTEQRSREQIESYLYGCLSVTNIIWLPGEPGEGDDTGGHIDNMARFVDPTTVVAVRAPEGHADHEGSEENWRALSDARDENGQKLQVVALPVPEPRFYDYPADEYHGAGRWQTPASYANFLLCNNSILFPVFGQPSDEQAMRIMEQVLPGYHVRPVPSDWLVVGQGGIHCLSQQQPRTE